MNCLTAVMFISMSVASALNAGEARTAVPEFPDLLPAMFPAASKWNRLGKEVLWKKLVQEDQDFVDPSTNRTVPPAFPGAVLKAPVVCGRTARMLVSRAAEKSTNVAGKNPGSVEQLITCWCVQIRFSFHDCGTFDLRTRRGGCNGSLRKEIPATDKYTDPATVRPSCHAAPVI